MSTAGIGSMSIVRELLDDAIAMQKDGLSPNRIGLTLTDRWEAEELGAAGKARREPSQHEAAPGLRPTSPQRLGAKPQPHAAGHHPRRRREKQHEPAEKSQDEPRTA